MRPYFVLISSRSRSNRSLARRARARRARRPPPGAGAGAALPGLAAGGAQATYVVGQHLAVHAAAHPGSGGCVAERGRRSCTGIAAVSAARARAPMHRRLGLSHAVRLSDACCCYLYYLRGLSAHADCRGEAGRGRTSVIRRRRPETRHCRCWHCRRGPFFDGNQTTKPGPAANSANAPTIRISCSSLRT